MQALLSGDRIFRTMLLWGALASAVGANAQDVVFVDDLAAAQPSQQGSLPTLKGRTGNTRKLTSARMPKSLPGALAAAPTAPQPQATLHESGGNVFSRFAAGVKGVFSQTDTAPTAKHTAKSVTQRNSGIQPVAYNAPQQRPSARVMTLRNDQLQLRQGDQRVGLLDGMFGSKSGNQPSSTASTRRVSNPKLTRTNKRAQQQTARSSQSRPVTKVAKNPTRLQAPSKSEGVWISDDSPMPTLAKRSTPARSSQAGLPKLADPKEERSQKPMVSISDVPTLAKPACPDGLDAPMVVVSGPAEEAPRPMVPAPKSVTLAAKAPQPMAKKIATPQKLAKAVPAKMPAPAPLPMASTAVLPNPVKTPVKPPQQPSERALALLAEANLLASSAKSEDQLGRVLQQCRHVLAIDDSPAAVKYCQELAAWALNKRGELKADRGEVQQAMADFNAAVAKDSQRWRAVHNRGVLLAEQGNYTEAFAAFNQTVELNPKFAKAYSNRASLFMQAGDFQTALKDYKQAISIDPDLVIAHKGRGRVCHVLGNLEQALRHFEAAVLLAPGDASIATCRADLLMDMGKYAQAVQGYQQAIQIDPQLATAYRNLAWLQATCPQANFRHPAEALANAERAMELSDNNDDICLDTLAAALATNGEFALAVETIQQAIAIAPAADQQEYEQRLKLYEEGMPFISAPAEVRQASYQQPAHQ